MFEGLRIGSFRASSLQGLAGREFSGREFGVVSEAIESNALNPLYGLHEYRCEKSDCCLVSESVVPEPRI